MRIVLTHHAKKRIMERFGLNKSATQRFVEKIADGKILTSTKEHIIITKHGNTFIFKEDTDSMTKEPILLLISACNDEKTPEWKVHSRGKIIKKQTVKQSKKNTGAPICKEKRRGNRVNNEFYNELYCA